MRTYLIGLTQCLLFCGLDQEILTFILKIITEAVSGNVSPVCAHLTGPDLAPLSGHWSAVVIPRPRTFCPTPDTRTGDYHLIYYYY